MPWELDLQLPDPHRPRLRWNAGDGPTDEGDFIAPRTHWEAIMLKPSFLSTKASRRRSVAVASALAITALFAKESMLSNRKVAADLLASLEGGLLYRLRHYESDIQAILIYNSLDLVSVDGMRAAFRRISRRTESLPKLLSMFIQDGAQSSISSMKAWRHLVFPSSLPHFG